MSILNKKEEQMAMTKKATRKKTTRSKGSNKGTEKLKKIVTEAKKIYKASPRKKWQTCVKEAAKKI